MTNIFINATLVERLIGRPIDWTKTTWQKHELIRTEETMSNSGREDTWTPDPQEEIMRSYLRSRGYGGDWKDSDHNDATAYLSGADLLEAYVQERIKAVTDIYD
jgi:hypothetical protein